MDDLYGDLENYTEANVVAELKNENKELKFKLEEYTSSMEKLQKNILQDFDKVSMEFKKLEINYSSLLKTARAEIERKTQIITNLSMEKDMLVLSSIQNNNKSLLAIRRSLARDKSNMRKLWRDDGEASKTHKKDAKEWKRHCPDTDRSEENRHPSTDTVISTHSEEINKLPNQDNKSVKIEMYDKASESKENIAKPKRAQTLKNRRKSMPVLGKLYSSDDEYEGTCSGEDAPRDYPSKEDRGRKTFDRHKQSHKISETSGIDEKYSSYHESSRETYYRRGKSRYNDKYRPNRYETRRYDDVPKYRRHLSPERGRRPTRDYKEEHYQRQDIGRHRVLESPPLERYDPVRIVRDKGSQKERDDSQDRYKSQQERPTKHRISQGEEPVTKRVRTVSVTKSLEEELPNRTKEGSQAGNKLLQEIGEQLQPTTCQSPDFMSHDLEDTQPKEIMSTATVQLEDPRRASSKYINQKEGDKPMLSTLTGKNMDFIVIDKSKWNLEDTKLPTPLKKPPQQTDDAIKELYMDVQDPGTPMSMESGEIHSETNDGFMADYVTESFFQDYEAERINQLNAARETDIVHLRDRHAAQERRRNIPCVENIYQHESQDEKGEGSQTERKLPPVKYKIPRINKSEKDNQADNSIAKTKLKDKESVQLQLKNQEGKKDDIPNPLKILLSQLKETCNVDTSSKPDKDKLDVDKTFGEEEDHSHDDVSNPKNIQNKHDVSTSRNTQSKPKKKIDSKPTRSLRTRQPSAREIVEGDLALSDETSDLIETQKKPFKTTERQVPTKKTILKIDDEKDVAKPTKQQSSKKIKKTKSDAEIKSDKSESKKSDSTEVKKSSALEANKTNTLDAKKSNVPEAKTNMDIVSEKPPEEKPVKKPKKKSPKTKTKDDTSKAAGGNVPGIKNTKDDKKLDKKAKFSDLFGDSSSLMTPEDIGIQVVSETVPTAKYVPIFEDAQDGIDVQQNTFKDPTIETKIPDAIEDKILKPVDEINKITNTTEVGHETAKEIRLSIPEGASAVKVSDKITKEPEVVRTVIISTGVQPYVQKDPSDVNKEVAQPVLDPQIAMLRRVQEAPIALATSTPHKRLIQLETVIETSCASSDTGQKDETSSIDRSSLSNSTMSQQLDADVPDVRIFVKRRRRVKK